ncbi:MAG: beta-galactosidase, partial [Armatimonadetes bacterium]|nr:beta-galactosidase [Armatimonadota bacterium]
MLRCLPLWCLLGLSAVLAAPSLEDEHSLPTDFVTPHTRWAKPSPDGPVRVLYFSDYRRCQAREIIELMQRFDLRAEAAYYTTLVDTTITQWHGGEAGVERIRRLLDQPFDVYLFQELALTRLPAELQYKLLKRVAEGAGLVLVGVDDARVLKRAIHGRPGWPEADLFAMRAGRAAKLPRTPAIPYRFGWETDYDHWQERLGRTVLWAANKLPDEQPLATLTSSTIDRAAPPAVLATVAGEGPLTRLRLRRSDGWVATDGPSPTSVPFPAGLPAGAYHLDAWRGSAWSTIPFTVTSPRTAEVQLAREWGEVTDPLAGSVVLQGQSLPGETVVVELLDRRGRILARSAGSARDGRLAFAFPLEPHYPMLIQVRATLADTRGPAIVADAYYRLVKRHRDRFNFLVWDIPAGPTAPYAEEALAKLGMSLQLSGATPPPAMLAAYDVAYVPYTTRIMDDKDATGQIKPVPWNQEPEIDAYVQGIADKYLPARQHGVFVYSLGDETVTRGSDNSPSDLAAYRRFLADVYGQIGALNTSWGTAYASFDEISLLDRNDPREQAAKQAGNYARWYDRQAWECRNFVNLCRRFGEAYREMDTQARTGFEGAGRFDKGDDFDAIVRTNGFWAPYPGPGDLLIRDIAPRDFPRANWTGYDKEPTPLIHEYWRMILNGNDSVWWWRWDNIGRFMGLLMPNLSPFAEIQELWDDTRITREGLGDLLLSWEMQHDGIAMLYSMPSAYASLCGDGPSYGSYQQAHEAWHKSLFNAGLNFRYVTDEMLRRGELDAGQFKVLILPRAEALSDQEAAAIRAFAAQGGTVVADLRPGRFDGRCKPRQ